MAGTAERHKPVWVPRMHRFLEQRGGAAPKSAVIEEGMRHVPGGVAYRVGHQKRTADSAHRNFGVAGELRSKDAATLVRAGANKLVCNSLYYERKAGRIEEVDGADGTKWLKLVRDENDSQIVVESPMTPSGRTPEQLDGGAISG